eukprot:TRINITY_DN68704_c0_g1_i1.p1 TRINITY_DN68704_c0_g1~~TRINITY_DN68704_c0_g1_i1.p1  ORF type:complete len:393 (+),score=53.94 TRINITY_DN68704_c0_g1_i1:92-1270(+)
MPRMGRRVSELCMAAPGPTEALDFESHLSNEKLLKTRHAGETETQQRLSDFIAARDAYWSANPPSHIHRNVHRTRDLQGVQPNRGLSGARYTLSADLCWVMETFASAGDMCFVTSRYIFNLWTFEQLVESDMHPWASLQSAVQPQDYDQWDGDSAVADGTSPILVETSPDLHHNVGCHDSDSEDEGPRPDYESGCRSVDFLELDLKSPRRLSRKVQVICASRFANTFDKRGTHWIYVLPSSPLERLLESCCVQSKIPPLVSSKLWEFARSWTETPKHAMMGLYKSETLQMKISPNWPYPLLRVRRHAFMLEPTEHTTDDVIAIVPAEALSEFVFLIDLAKSTLDFWKLSASSKEAFVAQDYMLQDFNAEEGFIIKVYNGHTTLTEDLSQELF